MYSAMLGSDTMAVDAGGPRPRSELWLALQRLTNGLGVQRPDLIPALSGELRALREVWGLNLGQQAPSSTVEENATVRKILILNLRAHIGRISPPRGRSPHQYRHAVILSFNAFLNEDRSFLADADLSVRRNWLADKAPKELRVSVSTSQRYLNNALDQIEKQLLSPSNMVGKPQIASGNTNDDDLVANSSISVTATEEKTAVESSGKDQSTSAASPDEIHSEEAKEEALDDLASSGFNTTTTTYDMSSTDNRKSWYIVQTPRARKVWLVLAAIVVLVFGLFAAFILHSPSRDSPQSPSSANDRPTSSACSSLTATTDAYKECMEGPDVVDGKLVPYACPETSTPTSASPSSSSGNAVLVDLYQKASSLPCWSPIFAPATPGQKIYFEIRYQNNSPDVQRNVEFRVGLPKNFDLVPGSTYLKNGNNPQGLFVESNSIATDGILTGDYAPGAAGYVLFLVKFPLSGDLKCGLNELAVIAYAQPQGMNYYYNTANTQAIRQC